MYGIRELSDLAGVSARTLRYYDEIGLLKPRQVKENGYRYYGEAEVELLQQILFYRERGFELKQIQEILTQDDFQIMSALQEHLLELEKQKTHMERLIHTVKQTISSMKGECSMSDKEKFQALKETLVKENEDQYGKEIREKYGEEEVNASNRKLLDMSEEEYDNFKKLESEVKEKLKDCVRTEAGFESEEAKEAVKLHKEWLCQTWKQYSSEAHKGLASMYVQDERFKKYYDEEVSGCAEFLKDAVSYWAGKLEKE